MLNGKIFTTFDKNALMHLSPFYSPIFILIHKHNEPKVISEKGRGDMLAWWDSND